MSPPPPSGANPARVLGGKSRSQAGSHGQRGVSLSTRLPGTQQFGVSYEPCTRLENLLGEYWQTDNDLEKYTSNIVCRNPFIKGYHETFTGVLFFRARSTDLNPRFSGRVYDPPFTRCTVQQADGIVV